MTVGRVGGGGEGETSATPTTTQPCQNLHWHGHYPYQAFHQAENQVRRVVDRDCLVNRLHTLQSTNTAVHWQADQSGILTNLVLHDIRSNYSRYDQILQVPYACKVITSRNTGNVNNLNTVWQHWPQNSQEMLYNLCTFLEWSAVCHSSIQGIWATIFLRHQLVLSTIVGRSVLYKGAMSLQTCMLWGIRGSIVDEVVFIIDGLMGECQDGCFSCTVGVVITAGIVMFYPAMYNSMENWT